TWPALRPAVASAGLITFLLTFTSFGVIRILGGVSHSTLEVEIYRQTAELLNLPVASVLALIQLVAVGTLLVVPGGLARRWTSGGIALRPARRRRATGGREQAWVGANLAVMAVLLGAPLAVLVERSFATGDGHGLAAWRALSGNSSRTGLFVAPLDA